MEYAQLIMQMRDALVSIPFLWFVVATSVLCTIWLKGVQIRYFVRAWKEVLFPAKVEQSADMTPFQAFINTLSTNLGNGSLAGMATAVHAGGPGAAFWVIFFGLFMMSLRFAEVYLSTWYGARSSKKQLLGGPMLYLQDLKGGSVLAVIYALCCIFFGVAIGNAAQANSIRYSITSIWPHIDVRVIAAVATGFMIYALCGGAERIVRISNKIVPLKVGLFFLAAIGLLIFHIQAIPAALFLILKSAFQPMALAGGAIGFTVQRAIQFGMLRSVMATESGLGTAAILFGFTGSKDPLHSGLMGMLSTFVSTGVCFLIALCIVVSGTWQSGLDGTALTSAAFSTAFGIYGQIVVAFLSIIFGIGVSVAYAYIVRAAWQYMTNGRGMGAFIATYALSSGLGVLLGVEIVWALGDIFMAIMVAINLYALLCFLPLIAREIQQS